MSGEKRKIIKTGFCVAYDWELLKNSLPKVYDASDVICLAIDRDRHSWSCNAYDFNDKAFYSFVKKIDKENKIDIYEDDFSLPNLNARENCNRHRTMIADRMGKGGWHIQVDADEYFLNFKGFTQYLKTIHPCPQGLEKPLNVCVGLIPLIKKLEDGFLYVDFKNKIPENAPFATNLPRYERARNNGHFNVLSPFMAVHETWARGEEELNFKLNNWGHSAEELEANARRNSFLKLWKALDKYNYRLVRDIHPAKPTTWPAIKYLDASSVDEFIEKIKDNPFPLSSLELKLNNSRILAKIKSLF